MEYQTEWWQYKYKDDANKQEDISITTFRILYLFYFSISISFNIILLGCLHAVYVICRICCGKGSQTQFNRRKVNIKSRVHTLLCVVEVFKNGSIYSHTAEQTLTKSLPPPSFLHPLASQPLNLTEFISGSLASMNSLRFDSSIIITILEFISHSGGTYILILLLFIIYFEGSIIIIWIVFLLLCDVNERCECTLMFSS